MIARELATSAIHGIICASKWDDDSRRDYG